MFFSRKPLLCILIPALLCSSLVLAAGKPAKKRSAKPVASVADAPTTDCQCTEPWRTYTRQPTPEFKQLFQAARIADEANFTRLIASMQNLDEYAIDDRPLLSALLYPVEGLSDSNSTRKRKVWWEMDANETVHLRAAHQATLPAKTRMLALALQHGASAKEYSFAWRHSPMQLAQVFGSPEMVKLLLQHGADPNDGFEFALDHEFFMRMTYLPDLVEPEQRSEMLLAMLAAGAKRPYDSTDKIMAKEDPANRPPRPAADYLLWPQLAWQTRGAEVMEAISKTGTMPVLDEENGYGILSMAAQAGNLGGVHWLKTHLPRTLLIEQGTRTIDLWALAASRALFPVEHDYSNRPVDAILAELIVPDLNWEQENGHTDASYQRMQTQLRPGFDPGSTLLHHLVLSGNTNLIRKIIEMGAPIEGSKQIQTATPLQMASSLNQLAMVNLLLSLGANPLAGPKLEESALYTALGPDINYAVEKEGPQAHSDRLSIIAMQLKKLTPSQTAALSQASPSPYRFATRYDFDEAVIRHLVNAQIAPGNVDPEFVIQVMAAKDKTLPQDLLKLPIQINESSKAPSTYRPADPSVLLAALELDRNDLLEALIKAGANPEHRGEFNKTTAMEWAIKTHNQPAIDLFLAHGKKITGQNP